MNLQLVKPFISGMAIGVFIAMIAWFYSVFIEVSIPLIPEIIATSLLGISFGILMTFGNADNCQEKTNIKFAKRFISGMAIGVFIAMIAWYYSVFCNVSIPLVQEVIGTLFLAVSCGVVASFGSIDKLMDNIPI